MCALQLDKELDSQRVQEELSSLSTVQVVERCVAVIQAWHGSTSAEQAALAGANEEIARLLVLRHLHINGGVHLCISFRRLG